MKKQYATLELNLILYNEQDMVRTSLEFDGGTLFGGDGWSED